MCGRAAISSSTYVSIQPPACNGQNDGLRVRTPDNMAVILAACCEPKPQWWLRRTAASVRRKCNAIGIQRLVLSAEGWLRCLHRANTFRFCIFDRKGYERRSSDERKTDL